MMIIIKNYVGFPISLHFYHQSIQHVLYSKSEAAAISGKCTISVAKGISKWVELGFVL